MHDYATTRERQCALVPAPLLARTPYRCHPVLDIPFLCSSSAPLQQGAASVSPAEAKLLLGPSAGALNAIADGLKGLHSAISGDVPLLNTLNDAAGVLGFVNGLGGDAVSGLLQTAVGLIGNIVGL